MNDFSKIIREPKSTRWQQLKQWMIEFEAAFDDRSLLWGHSGRVAKLEARIAQLEETAKRATGMDSP